MGLGLAGVGPGFSRTVTTAAGWGGSASASDHGGEEGHDEENEEDEEEDLRDAGGGAGDAAETEQGGDDGDDEEGDGPGEHGDAGVEVVVEFWIRCVWANAACQNATERVTEPKRTGGPVWVSNSLVRWTKAPVSCQRPAIRPKPAMRSATRGSLSTERLSFQVLPSRKMSRATARPSAPAKTKKLRSRSRATRGSWSSAGEAPMAPPRLRATPKSVGRLTPRRKVPPRLAWVCTLPM